jgi:hypothetical protein
MLLAQRVSKEVWLILFGLLAVLGTILAASPCIFFILHDGGDEVQVPAHMQG